MSSFLWLMVLIVHTLRQWGNFIHLQSSFTYRIKLVKKLGQFSLRVSFIFIFVLLFCCSNLVLHLFLSGCLMQPIKRLLRHQFVATTVSF